METFSFAVILVILYLQFDLHVFTLPSLRIGLVKLIDFVREIDLTDLVDFTER